MWQETAKILKIPAFEIVGVARTDLDSFNFKRTVNSEMWWSAGNPHYSGVEVRTFVIISGQFYIKKDLSIAWIPVPKEIGKSVDQSIESKLTSPTKTVRLDLALLRRVQMMKNLRWRTRRAIKVYKITGKQFSVLISTTISSAFSFSRSKRRKACRSVSIANNTPPPTLPSQPLR